MKHHATRTSQQLHHVLGIVVVATVAISGVVAADPQDNDTQANLLQMGCLYSKNLTSKMRVCNSEDPVEAAGVYCRVPLVRYDEIRISPGNWDSVSCDMVEYKMGHGACSRISPFGMLYVSITGHTYRPIL
jgi:hypothetical protein